MEEENVIMYLPTNINYGCLKASKRQSNLILVHTGEHKMQSHVTFKKVKQTSFTWHFIDPVQSKI